MTNAAVIAKLKAQLGEFSAPKKRQIAGIEFPQSEISLFRPNASFMSWFIARALEEKQTVALIGWPELNLIEATHARIEPDQLICIPEGDVDAAAIAAEGFDLVIIRTHASLSRGQYHRFQSKVRGSGTVCLLVHTSLEGIYPFYQVETKHIIAHRRIHTLGMSLSIMQRGRVKTQDITIGMQNHA
ncbi:MAG: hypothetical protein Q3962_07605 [Corynebacterium sp.]|nr:hypothetical protein [Corynebacterium sp.]